MLRDDKAGGAGRRAARNVLGEPVEICSFGPMMGFFWDGCCNTGPEDIGGHTICPVRRQHVLDRISGMRKGGFLAHRRPSNSIPEMMCTKAARLALKTEPLIRPSRDLLKQIPVRSIPSKLKKSNHAELCPRFSQLRRVRVEGAAVVDRRVRHPYRVDRARQALAEWRDGELQLQIPRRMPQPQMAKVIIRELAPALRSAAAFNLAHLTPNEFAAQQIDAALTRPKRRRSPMGFRTIVSCDCSILTNSSKDGSLVSRK